MTETTNFNFNLTDFDKIPWHNEEHDNWHLADALIARYLAVSNVQGVWQNALAVTVGHRFIDATDDTIWEVLVAHTTSSTLTFPADRTANTTYWQSISIDVTFAGVWADDTGYSINQFVTDASRYGVVSAAHTSTTSYDTGVAAGNIVTLVDLSDEVAATAADVVSTNADVVTTTAKVALTNADVVLTNADVVSTNADVVTTTALAASVAFKYVYDTSTTDADPGTGKFRWDAAVGSATGIYIDDTTSDTGNPNISAFFNTWGSGASAVKGHILFKKYGTPATFALFNVTAAVTDNSGYSDITVALVANSGTWTNGDTAFISYIKAGDKGTTGDTGASGASNIVLDTSPQLGGDLDCNASQIQWSKGADVASNGALAVLTDGNYFDVTGTTTITSINTTGGTGTLIKLHFDGACQLTHHASNLILAGAANFTTEAGDELEFVEYGSGTYRMTGWCLAGTAPGGGGGGAFLGEGASGASVGSSGDIIRVNEATLNTSQSMAATDNGSATGPLSIASGVTLTISSGATFVVI
jgi:hypothetical protein